MSGETAPQSDPAPARSGGTLMGIWTYFAFSVVSIVGYFSTLIVFLLIFPFDKNRKVTGTLIRFWGRRMVGAVPAWTMRTKGEMPASLPERTVVVSNHCSNMDPFLLAHLPWEMKFLAKSVLFKIPCVGWGMTLAGDVCLKRGSAQSVKKAMRECADYVRAGMPVVIFAEGTRSRTDEMLPFKDGAFRLALETGASILPVAVTGTHHALKKGDWKPGYSDGRVEVGLPISTEGMTLKDVGQLKALTRTAIEGLRHPAADARVAS